MIAWTKFTHGICLEGIKKKSMKTVKTMKVMNTLSPQDAKLFYDIWFPLLDHINLKYSILPHVKSFEAMKGQNSIEPSEAKQVANKLWARPTEEIDDYLATAEGASLSSEKKELLNSWKRALTGTFFIERHLKSGSVLIGRPDRTGDSAEDSTGDNTEGRAEGTECGGDLVFLVCGLNSPLEEMFPKDFVPLPAIVKATLIPFKDVIVTDGLLERYNIFSGGGVKRMLKETYSEAKKSGKIIKKV